MNTLTRSDFVAHLNQLGLEPGDRVCVHSRLLSFGRIEGAVEMVLDRLLDTLGPNGTLAVPTFTLNLTGSEVFDLRTTPSFGTGALSETVRQHPEARRTNCPLHSFAAVGPASDHIVRADPTRPVGPGSAFQIMRDQGFKLILLG
ncbi:unnamed protein product, partial [Ectocarpus sp. 12 AP-2014]